MRLQTAKKNDFRGVDRSSFKMLNISSAKSVNKKNKENINLSLFLFTLYLDTPLHLYKRVRLNVYISIMLFSMNRKWAKYIKNKAVYTATLVACGWAGAMIKKVY